VSFADLLRKSRSSRIAVLHKFLTNYDPYSPRVYAFVEGEPDAAFYRTHIGNYVRNPDLLFIYDCGGKPRVYETYNSVVARFPHCARVLFFVDKDLDDLVSQAWPTDPRIFATEVYSIENYLVCKDLVTYFFKNFVKIKGLELDLRPPIDLFDEQLRTFHRLLLPIMAWIVAMRRAGNKVVLTDVTMAALYIFGDEGPARKTSRATLEYLSRVTKTARRPGVWREVRRVAKELRRLPPKRYARGKFEAWYFIKFIRKITEDVSKVATEAGGSISVRAQLEESNFIQLLSSALPTPPTLDTFLKFHFSPRTAPIDSVPDRRRCRRILEWVLQLGRAALRFCGVPLRG
jgi:uncharacterized protein DUF4435